MSSFFSLKIFSLVLHIAKIFKNCSLFSLSALLLIDSCSFLFLFKVLIFVSLSAIVYTNQILLSLLVSIYSLSINTASLVELCYLRLSWKVKLASHSLWSFFYFLSIFLSVKYENVQSPTCPFFKFFAKIQIKHYII